AGRGGPHVARPARRRRPLDPATPTPPREEPPQPPDRHSPPPRRSSDLMSRTPSGLWTREASWSAPRRRGAFDPASHTHSREEPPHHNHAAARPTREIGALPRPPSGLWTRQASLSAPRRCGAADPPTHTH